MTKHSTTILGIHYWHDSGAAIVKDGKILAAINEERIRNIKHFTGYPENSIAEVFKISKIDPSEIDAIAIPGATHGKFPKAHMSYPRYFDLFLQWSWINSYKPGLKQLVSYRHNFPKFHDMKKILDKLGVPTKKILFVEHHLSHGATAYYLSPWSLDDEILIFTSDGEGDGISSTVSIGSKGKITRLDDSETTNFDSLGRSFYAQISGYLGMKWGQHASKVMGLAPYGNPDLSINQVKQIIDINKTNPLKFQNKMGTIHASLHPRIHQLFEGHRFDNVAAATQLWYEHLITTWIKKAIEITGIKKIACAGGNFQNVKANQKIMELDEVDDAFFCPAAGDDGIAVGAALQAYFELTLLDGICPNKHPLKACYFGSSFENEDIKELLKKHNLLEKSEFFDDVDGELGELLSHDEIIAARFNGQTEWGPRALGNRSILANPSNPLMVRKINQAVKKRDFWMPFAPSVLSSRLDDYIVNPRMAPYMILGFDTTEQRKDFEAVIHPYDLTCRPQTVNSDYNPSYEKVIKSFESKTGIGIILNTSLNIHGFPLCNSPETAIETFQNSSIDVLAIGNYILKK